MKNIIFIWILLLAVDVFHSLSSSLIIQNKINENSNCTKDSFQMFPNRKVTGNVSDKMVKHAKKAILHNEENKDKISVNREKRDIEDSFSETIFSFVRNIAEIFYSKCDVNDTEITIEKTNKTQINTITNKCNKKHTKYEYPLIRPKPTNFNFCKQKWKNEIPLDRSNVIENSFNNSEALQSFIFQFNFDEMMKEITKYLHKYEDTGITVETYVEICKKIRKCRDFFKNENRDIKATFYDFLDLTTSDIIKLYVYDKKYMKEDNIYYNILHNKTFLNSVFDDNLLNHCLINNMKFPDYYEKINIITVLAS